MLYVFHNLSNFRFLHRFQTQNKRRKVGESFQSEIDTLNSLHEDIMNDFDSARLNELEIHGEEITGPDSLMYQILPRTIIEVAKIKAHAQERRHREYIECVNKFGKIITMFNVCCITKSVQDIILK